MQSSQAPIDGLPNELLAEVFDLCTPIFPPLNSDSLPSDLLRVCRRWRDVANDTPRLWTLFKLTFFGDRHLQLPTIVSTWIQRSHPLPISIRAEMEDVEVENASLEGIIALERVIQAVSAVSRRWKVMWFILPPLYADRIVCAAQNAPLCTGLSFRVPRAIANYDAPAFQLRLLDTSLFILEHMPVTVVGSRRKLESIWGVKIDVLTDADSFVQLIKSTSNLEKLCLKFMAARMGYEGDLIVAEKLDTLSVTFHLDLDEVVLRSIFQTVTAPALTTLYLTELGDCFSQVSYAQLFLARSRCPLRRFYYNTQEVGYELSHIYHICKQTPTLEQVELRTVAYLGEFKRFFNLFEDEGFLPRLKSFTFEIVDQDCDERMIPYLRELGELRCGANGGELEEVIIYSCHTRPQPRLTVNEVEPFGGLRGMGVKFVLRNCDIVPRTSDWDWL